MIQRNFVHALIVAASLFAGLGLTAFAIENPQVTATAGESLDATLNDKVETLLRTDVGLAGSQFRILARAGVVTIGGTVPDEHSLRRALDLASNVKGVREVRNAMEIDPPN